MISNGGKKKIKKVDSAVKERHFGVILEDIDSKVDLLVFYLIHNDLKEKVGRDEFIVLEKRVSILEKKLVR